MQVSDNFVTRTELLETGAVCAAKTVIEILENRRHGYFKKVSITKNAEHTTVQLRRKAAARLKPVTGSNG